MFWGQSISRFCCLVLCCVSRNQILVFSAMGGGVKGRFRKSDVPKNQSLVACYLLGISSIARLCEQSQLH